MGFIPGSDRTQPLLLPARIDDYVAADAPVRVIDAFVDSLNLLNLGFERTRPAETGRPGYDPGDMLKLYIYGYLSNLRSSRRLEKACLINLELCWLLRTLRPDFKTIADFRRDNPDAIAGVCRAFVQFCRKANLFAGAIAAIDGTKLRAAASRRRIMSREEVAKEIIDLDRRIGDYLLAMDTADATETDDVSAQHTKAALQALRDRRDGLIDLAGEMEREDRKLGVEGEIEARPMGKRGGPKPPCYNVQAAVDPKSHMIVHHEVTTEATDNRLLSRIARKTKDVLAVETLTAVADAGYANATQVADCEAAGIVPALPAPPPANTRGDYFPAEVFRRDTDSDSLICPAGRRLTRNGGSKRDREIRYRAVDCSGCPLKSQCTDTERRYVYRHIHHDAMQRARDRVEQDKTLMLLRRCTVEHAFASLKHYLGHRLLLRGTLNAGTETALAVLAYNIKRAIKLFGGCKAMIERLA
jgi:transposase